MIFGVNWRVIQVLTRMRRKGSISYSNVRDLYCRLAYYMVISRLKDSGIIQYDGVNSDGEKMWKLTKEGEMFIDAIERIERKIKRGRKNAISG